MRTLASVLILSVAAAPASSALAFASPQPKAAQASPPTTIVVEGKKKEKKVCKTFDAPTGSRIGEQRICKTQAQWDFEEGAKDRAMARENLRLYAENSQRHNEEGGFAIKLPH